MKQFRYFFFFFFSFAICLQGAQSPEDKTVKSIEVQFEHPDPTYSYDKSLILNRMKTKANDHFSQTIFDSDLKMLYDEFDKVDPVVTTQDNQVVILLKIWPKPLIHSISWEGNTVFSTSKLQKELDVKPNTIFNRSEFNKKFNKLKEFYVKRGYFDSELSYSIEPTPGKNAIEIFIHVQEGPSGRIKRIIFNGFTKKETSQIMDMILTKQYNFLLSWLTGKGLYNEDMLEQDRMLVINLLHNKGYADATVDIAIQEDPVSNKLIVRITANRGTLYHIGKVTFSGNHLVTDEEILKKMTIHEGSIYSPEEVRNTSQAIKDIYGHKGYIEADIQYNAILMENEPVVNIDYTLTEGEEFRIGLIRVFGNERTQTKIILRESLLVPGDLFDSRKLKATQERLEAVGYFEHVNVYAVRSTDDLGLGSNYRDVYIEVSETRTGSFSLFTGFSTNENITGGLDLTERNFNIKGITKLFGQPHKLRGGGEYLHTRLSVGKKQTNFLISWMDPYFRDSLWRFGFELSETTSTLQSSAYDIITYGGSVFAQYPITALWTYGLKYRFRYTTADVDKSAGEAALALENGGILSAIVTNLSYDSTNSPYKPFRGLRSTFEAEFSGVGGKFIFLKLSYVNTLYLPLWKRGIAKCRLDLRTAQPFFGNAIKRIPLSERYFLGGDQTVRGYKPYILGKKSSGGDPLGGLTSILLSGEYDHEIFRRLDFFGFIDAGMIAQDPFSYTELQASAGVGARIEVMNKAPIMVGWGFPINPKPGESQKFFFSMAGQF